jgi:hypothetical protein
MTAIKLQDMENGKLLSQIIFQACTFRDLEDEKATGVLLYSMEFQTQQLMQSLL